MIDAPALASEVVPQTLATSRVPRVSIIIPCYKTAGLVADTLRSVYEQTYKDFEVVLVNDGSPDTPQLEQAIAPWRERLTYVHTENCGLAGARNNGIRAARGELIALLDSDDMWEPNYLDVQVRMLDARPDVDIVYPTAMIFGDFPGLTEFPRSHGDVNFISLVQERCVVMVSVLARRKALEGAGLFDSDLRSCEDFDMWLRCVKNGSRIIYHTQPLVRYRRRPDSLSADPVWMCSNASKVLQKIRTSVVMTKEERKVVDRAIMRFEGRKLFFEGKKAFNSGDVATAIERFKESNRYLHSPRIWMILQLLRVAPSFARHMYGWRTRRNGDDFRRA